MSQPLISIVIPCHNCAEFIGQCIDSVEGQDYPRIELVIVEDSSTDGSWEIIEDRQRQANWISAHQVSFRSPARTRNFGIKKTRGKFVATLDADDYFLPARISTMVNFLERDQADIVISDCFELDESGHMTRFSEEHLRGGGHLTVEDYLRFIMPAPPMFLAKKRVLEEIHYYDEELKYLEDQDLFIRALQNGFKVSFLNQPLYVHRLRPDTLSDAKLKESLAWREAYKRHWRTRHFSLRQHRIIFAQILATTFRYYYFRYAPALSWPKKMKILRKVF